MEAFTFLAFGDVNTITINEASIHWTKHLNNLTPKTNACWSTIVVVIVELYLLKLLPDQAIVVLQHRLREM